MITSVAPSHTVASRRLTRGLVIAVGVLVLVGFVWGNSGEQLLAYLLVLTAATLPGMLWIRMGSPGIPIFPIIGIAYIPYFGWPILSGAEAALDYTTWEILRAALAVDLFLIFATVAWRLMAGRVLSQPAIAQGENNSSLVVQFVLIGLSVGVMFHVAVILGLPSVLGSFFGVARSFAVTFVSVACFLIGAIRARGLLRGIDWAAAVAGIGLLLILSWSSLFLVGGISYSLACLLGYFIVSKRMPWLFVGAMFVAVMVLHAGKAEMRAKYWESDTNVGGVSSLSGLPGFAAEWVGEGIYAIATGSAGQSVLERASLFQMILRAQIDTPDRVEFLNGATYALLPSILVPRFIESNKPASQVGIDLLNIHYGLMTVDEAAVTAVGWGLVPEAYANFGYWGVIGIALIYGLLCGALQSWSANAPIMSLPTLICIAALMALINIEADFLQICSVLFQSLVSVFVFVAAFRRYTIRPSAHTLSGTGTR